MKCPDCGWVAEDPSLNFIGQSMCPACGKVLDFTDIIGHTYIISNEVSDEEKA